MMFERFTERARKSVVLAQEEAREMDHSAIFPEHLLLGLLREGQGVAYAVLASFGLTADGVRRDIAALTDYEEADSPVVGQIPFAETTKKVLELGLREALGLGHNYVGTEHLLLALSRSDLPRVTKILASAVGPYPDALRNRVVEMLGPKEKAAKEPNYLEVAAAAKQALASLERFGDDVATFGRLIRRLVDDRRKIR